MLVVMTVSLLLPSCYGTRTAVGNYRELVKVEKADTYTYAKGKQAYLFWGLIPLGRTQVATPADGSCQIRTCANFADVLVEALTGGIVTMRTIKVLAPVANKPELSAHTAD